MATIQMPKSIVIKKAVLVGRFLPNPDKGYEGATLRLGLTDDHKPAIAALLEECKAAVAANIARNPEAEGIWLEALKDPAIKPVVANDKLDEGDEFNERFLDGGFHKLVARSRSAPSAYGPTRDPIALADIPEGNLVNVEVRPRAWLNREDAPGMGANLVWVQDAGPAGPGLAVTHSNVPLLDAVTYEEVNPAEAADAPDEPDDDIPW